MSNAFNNPAGHSAAIMGNQSFATQNLVQHQQDLLQAQQANFNIVGGGMVNAPAAAASPPQTDHGDEAIQPLDFPHVKPGDLITAAFVNALIDVVVAIDGRLQRIEILLAPFIERETKRLQAQQSGGKD